MKKIISIIRWILAIALVVFGIVVAIYQIKQNTDFFGRIKIWGIYTLVAFVVALILKLTRDRKKDKGGVSNNISLDNNSDIEMALTSVKLSTWAYIIVLTIYTIIKAWEQTHNIFMIIFMCFFTILMQAGPYALVELGWSRLLLCDTSGDPSNQPKSRKIKATTWNWSNNWSTTTYRDENGNETKVDHWNFK